MRLPRINLWIPLIDGNRAGAHRRRMIEGRVGDAIFERYAVICPQVTCISASVTRPSCGFIYKSDPDAEREEFESFVQEQLEAAHTLVMLEVHGP